MRKKITILFILFSCMANAQNPVPAKPQKESVIILNATAHLGNGLVIPNAAIGFRAGKLTIVADATRIRIDKSEYPVVIDATGKDVYPGLIDCNSTLGLTEIDLVRSTRDFSEVGEMKPNVRSIIAYNTDSKIIPTVRSNGVLLSQIVPEGGTISGQSSVVELDGWNWEDAAFKTDDGIHVNWPRMFVVLNNPNETEEIQKQKIQNNLNALEKFIYEARAYSMNKNPEEKNLKFEAMRGLFDGSKKLYVHCDFVKEIVSAINLTARFGLKMVLVGGTDSYLIADLLKEKNIPVILGRTHSLPSREDADVDLPYKLPALLKMAGVEFALSMDGSWQTRNLAFQAGTTVGYGLSKEEALTAITLSPAKIMGIDSRVGSLEVGKDATLFISEGDVLDMRTNKITKAYIEGKEINLDNVQSQLYRKYMDKYGLKY
jgi:imidazolonepropionase-like amidohydrolase